MSLKPYPLYRESGLEWIGELPAGWESRRFKFCFDLQKRPIAAGMGVVTAFRDGEVTLRSKRRTSGFTEADKEIGYQGIEPGDLVIHAMDAFAGAIGVSDSRGKSTPVYSVCMPKPSMNSRFFAFVLRHLARVGYIESLAKGIRERSTDFRWADAREVWVQVPSFDEQRGIVHFLDRETAEIDAFITDQEELIALLNERRAATITQAVTKGLDPSAPMRDSGVEWLGLIPRHWSVRGIKAAAATVGGSGFPHEYQGLEDEEIPFYKVSALAGAGPDGVIRNSRDTVSRATAKVLGAKILPSGTIVMAKIGAALLLGRMRSVDRPFCIDNNMLALVPHRGYMARYLTYALQIVSFDLIVNPGAVPSLDMTAFRDYPLAFPEQEEQQSIVEFIDRELSQIDAAMTDAREAIALSKERRAALISAAVTGKIDVRDAMVSKQQLLEVELVVH